MRPALVSLDQRDMTTNTSGQNRYHCSSTARL